MNLCRVTGSVVSTVKNEHLIGQRIMICQPVQLDKKTPQGTSFLSVDRVQSGVGDLVLTIKEGGGCRIVLGNNETPVESLIVAIVDELEHVDPATLVGQSTLEHARAGVDA